MNPILKTQWACSQTTLTHHSNQGWEPDVRCTCTRKVPVLRKRPSTDRKILASLLHPAPRSAMRREATFAKSTFRPGNTALDRCGAAPKAVIDEGCGDFLGLDGSSAGQSCCYDSSARSLVTLPLATTRVPSWQLNSVPTSKRSL